MKDAKRVSQGKKNRAAGARFELKVRKDLESKGWIVDKWSNNIEFKEIYGEDILKKKVDVDKISWNIENKEVYDQGYIGKLIPSKRKYNPYSKVMAIGTGFPDFICFKTITYRLENYRYVYEIIGVEVKSNGYLTKEEKEKCKWLLDNNTFSKILIAKKGEKRGEIEYVEFKEIKKA